MAYRYRYFYKDGTDEISECCGKRPTLMYNDFDGLMDWDEFNNLSEKNMTTKEILEMAFKVYKGFLKDYYRIEIINDERLKINILFTKESIFYCYKEYYTY